jgi:hypothetical protein
MNAIVTKVLPQTNTKPARVKAVWGSHKAIVSYDCNELPTPKDAQDPHLRAVRKLCEKAGVVGCLVRADLPNQDVVWSFTRIGDVNKDSSRLPFVYCQTEWITGPFQTREGKRIDPQ